VLTSRTVLNMVHTQCADSLGVGTADNGGGVV
jgi:hypothetical protein